METLAPPKTTNFATVDLSDVIQLRYFTREEFYAMDRAGIFDNDYKVELIDGRIVKEMPPMGDEHGWSVEKLNFALVDAVKGTEYSMRVQSAVSLPGDRELQPDLLVYKPREDRPRLNPLAEQVLLVIEVSHSSLRFDRAAKAQLYAEAGIPEYWVVDVVHKKVHVYTQPEDGAYSRMEQRSTDDSLTVCGREFQIAGIF